MSDDYYPLPHLVVVKVVEFYLWRAFIWIKWFFPMHNGCFLMRLHTFFQYMIPLSNVFFVICRLIGILQHSPLVVVLLEYSLEREHPQRERDWGQGREGGGKEGEGRMKRIDRPVEINKGIVEKEEGEESFFHSCEEREEPFQPFQSTVQLRDRRTKVGCKYRLEQKKTGLTIEESRVFLQVFLLLPSAERRNSERERRPCELNPEIVKLFPITFARF